MASARERTWKLMAFMLFTAIESRSVTRSCFCLAIWVAFPVDEIVVDGQSRRHTVATQAERISRFTGLSTAKIGCAIAAIANAAADNLMIDFIVVSRFIFLIKNYREFFRRFYTRQIYIFSTDYQPLTPIIFPKNQKNKRSVRF
jgi:hypothetical protein